MSRLTALRTKSIPILILALAACVACCVALPARAQADNLTAGSGVQLATQASPYSLGKTVKGTVNDTDLYYGFTVNDSAGIDVIASVTNNSESSVQWYVTFTPALYVSLNDASGTRVWDEIIYAKSTEKSEKLYLPKGSYQLRVEGYQYPPIKFSFKISKQKPTLKLDKKSGTLKIGSDQKVGIYYNASDEYATKNLKVTSSQPKVAKVSNVEIGNNGSAEMTLTPKRMGKSTITVKMGGKTAKYTATVKSDYIYIAKGAKTKLAKPVGVKKIAYANANKKSKKIAPVTKKGVTVAKKQGRAVITGKVSKKVKYTYNVIVTDFKKLAKAAYNDVWETVPNPEELKIVSAYQGFYRNIYEGQQIPVVYVDYSFGNGTGGRDRSKIVAWFDDALDIKYIAVNNANNVIKKQAIKIR